eukprot:640063-Amphidinium_carterae.1
MRLSRAQMLHATGWASWNCRNKTSATVFTLLGVVCKFMSVLMNIMIWDACFNRAALLAGKGWTKLERNHSQHENSGSREQDVVGRANFPCQKHH